MAQELLEVDLSEKDALRALKQINVRKSVGLKAREGDQLLSDGQAYEITADGMSVGMFINLFVDGTWSASANMALGEE